MWKYIVLLVLGLIFVPIILVALSAAFIYMDISMLDPTTWPRDTRKMCVIWAGVILFCCVGAAAK